MITKYGSGFTSPVKISILILLLFWGGNFLAIMNANGIKDAMVFSVLMLVFLMVFALALVKGTSITIENNSVNYSQMLVLKETVDIGKIKKIQNGLLGGGLYSSLSLMSENEGKSRETKISTISFKRVTLKQFVSDLKKQNPQIVVDSSVNELL